MKTNKTKFQSAELWCEWNITITAVQCKDPGEDKYLSEMGFLCWNLEAVQFREKPFREAFFPYFVVVM